MVSMQITARPTKLKKPYLDEAYIRAWLRNTGEHGKQIFEQGLAGGHSGRVRRSRNQASAPGEYPANQTGALGRSIRVAVGSRSVTLWDHRIPILQPRAP